MSAKIAIRRKMCGISLLASTACGLRTMNATCPAVSPAPASAGASGPLRAPAPWQLVQFCAKSVAPCAGLPAADLGGRELRRRYRQSGRRARAEAHHAGPTFVRCMPSPCDVDGPDLFARRFVRPNVDHPAEDERNERAAGRGAGFGRVDRAGDAEACVRREIVPARGVPAGARQKSMWRCHVP